MLTRLLYLFVFVAFGFSSIGQNNNQYGNFLTKNFSANDYSGVAQNWDIIQTNDNFIIVANNSGILLFDGTNWENVKLENEEGVRSFSKTKNGDIFVGGVEEFGRVYFDEFGKFSYEKLSSKFDSLGIGTIWSTYTIYNDVYFISLEKIFILHDQGEETVKEINTNSKTAKEIKFAHVLDNTIYCYITSDSLNYCATFDGISFKTIKNSENFQAHAYFHANNLSYVVDLSGEIREIIKKDNAVSFEKIGNKLQLPEDSKINTVAVNKNIIAVGTRNGIFLFDKKGKFIRSFQENDGLENLQIRKLMFDHNNNLWSCNDNGITLIDLSNPITTFDKRNGITFATEDIYFDEKNTFLGSRTDLFYETTVENKKQYVNSEVFRMEVFQIKSFTFPDGHTKTLVIANNGIYEYVNGQKIEIAKLWAWDLYQSTSNPNRIWVGLDGDGLGSLLYVNGNLLVESAPIKNTSGEVRKVIEFNNKVYYAVKNEGIHILDTNKTQAENVLDGQVQFLPIDGEDINYQQYTLEIFDNTLYIGTDNGLYINENDKLVPFSDEFNIARLKVHRIFNENDTKLWLVLIRENGTSNESYEIGYIDFSTENHQYISTPFKSATKEVVQSISQDNKGYTWFGSLKEVYAYNPNTTNDFNDSVNVYISAVEILNDSILSHYNKYAKDQTATVNYEHNTITIKFTSTSYVGNIKNTYAYYLEGLDDSWSKWSEKTEETFPRLSEGKYVFHVKSKNYYGIESPEVIYKFTILPPWYRTWFAYFIYFVLVVIFIYIIIKLSIRRVKEQNEKLEKIVEERTAKVELQKEEIEEKNRDIVDSIKYAKRIQNTILPTDEFLDGLLENYFVIYRPKDIVSGDFYWADVLDGKAYFSAIDCTGHGVPGAFVSIVGFNGLKRTVNEFKHRQPGLILDKLTDIVVETFTATESHLKDGMDMTLCSLDYKTLKLEFAGANNPLILIRDGEIIETKGNKQPIGDFEHRIPFTNHEIQLQKGDCLYLFTDGYADQFGGPKGKKFKLKTLKNLLLEVSTLPIKEQKEQLEIAFDKWKGHIEQLDDVCLIGVKI